MAIRTVTRASVGLVVGIILIALLVLGGLLLVRERGQQARREEAITIADQQLKEESKQGVALDTNEDDNTTATESAPAPEPSSSTNATPAPAAASELPQTGPSAISFVAIGLLTFATASFVRSRTIVHRQL
jgi:FtsZ-interacting cell division protein ZipA